MGCKTGAEVQRYSGHLGYVLSVAFSPDGKYFTCNNGRKPLTWLITKKPLEEYLAYYLSPLEELVYRLSEEDRLQYGIYEVWDLIFFQERYEIE